MLRVLILEPTPDADNLLRKGYAQVFQDIPAEAEITVISDGNPKAARDLFSTQIVDVFITDLTFGSDDTLEGLNLCQVVKQEHPELFVIANTKGPLDLMRCYNKLPPPDMFISKMRLRNEKYRKYVTSVLRERVRRNTMLRVGMDGSGSRSQFSSKGGKIALESMLRSITFSGHLVESRRTVHDVTLAPMEGGLSNAEVYRMISRSAGGLECTRTVIKAGDREDIEKEVGNYDAYVRWYLPYRWRPEVVGVAYTRKHGAICYSFAYNDDVPFSTITEKLTAGDIESVGRIADTIFAPSFQRWYHQGNVCKEEKDIAQYYYDCWLARGAEHRLNDALASALPAERRYEGDLITCNDLRVYSPTRALLGRDWGHFTSCLTHGDMNTSNVLVAGRDDVTFIDFRHTGRGHVFLDFVVFEMSVRTHYRHSSSFEDMLAVEQEIVNGGSSNSSIEATSFVAVVLAIRRCAADNFPDEPWQNYLYAIAMNGCRVLMFKGFEASQRRQVAACVMVTLERLDGT